MHAAGCLVTYRLVHSVETLNEFVEVDGTIVVFIYLQKNSFGTQRVRFDPACSQHPFEVSEVHFIALATRLRMDNIVSVVQPDVDVDMHACIQSFEQTFALKFLYLSSSSPGPLMSLEMRFFSTARGSTMDAMLLARGCKAASRAISALRRRTP